MPDPRIDPSELTLLTPLAEIKGVRASLIEPLARLGIRTVADLIRHTPMRYERIEAEQTILEVMRDAGSNAIITARGEVQATRIVRHGRQPRFEAAISDGTGRLDAVWFNQLYLADKVFPGVQVRVQGKSKKFGYGVQMANPKLEVLKDDAEAAPIAGARVRSVYPASEDVSSAQIEATVRIVLNHAVKLIPEHLPEEYRRSRSLPPLGEAYRMAHAPETIEQGAEARRRLAYDELLLLQLGVFLRREQLRGTVRSPKLKWNKAIDSKIRARFPFALTGAQERVIGEIIADLGNDDPGNRLIQGDVGSGKTVVALYAMLMAVASKMQAALMAPTEILAEQHFVSISRMLEGSSVRVALLTGAVTGAERDALLRGIALGEIDIVIGTHALLTESVKFESLAVAVIDEQHRFGVHQRAALRSKGADFTAEDAEIAEKKAGRLIQDEEARGTGVPSRTSSRKGSSKPSTPPTASSKQGKSTPHTPPPTSAHSASSAVKPSSGKDTRPLAPHVLVMTATPIPRTLALTLFGDLDVSVIDELPPGRTPIVTRVVPPSLSGEVYQFVRKRIDAGEQAYIVVPAIDSGASSAGRGGDEELNDLRTVAARLEAHELAGKRIAAVHGRLKHDTRETIMGRFRAGLIDALVATTVIEVGVDVPNATIMVVEHAERFGLAQLHQLRGRIGRGSKKSVCVLISDPSAFVAGDSEERLRIMAESTDGFVIAEKDLEIRGPGEVFGMRQAGAPPFRTADLMLDRDLLALARRDAKEWIERSPRLDAPEERVLRTRLMRAHGEWLGLGDVG